MGRVDPAVAKAHNLDLHDYNRGYSNSSGQCIERAEQAATEKDREDMLFSSPGWHKICCQR